MLLQLHDCLFFSNADLHFLIDKLVHFHKYVSGFLLSGRICVPFRYGNTTPKYLALPCGDGRMFGRDTQKGPILSTLEQITQV